MDIRKRSLLPLVIILGFYLTLTSFSAMSAKLYKWVDEEGNVHYTDIIPPEGIKNKHSRLSADGIALETTEKEKTKQERLRLKQQAEQKKAQLEKERKEAAEKKRRQEIQRAYDQQLLSTYLTENDLISMRDRQIATIEGTITLTQSNLKKLDIQLQKFLKDAEAAKPDSEFRKKLTLKVLQTQEQIKEYTQFISNRRMEQNRIRTKFNSDLARLRQLLAAKTKR